MKRMMPKILIAVFCVFGFGLCYTQDTSAIITGAWVNWNSGIDSDGGTTFGIGMNYNTWAEQYGAFRCTSPGAAYTTSICGWDEYWSWNDDLWDYYWVDLYPCYDQQNVGGYIRARRWGSLTANAKRTDTGAVLNGNISSSSGWAGERKTVNRCGYNPEGFTFSHWDDGSTGCEYGRNATGNESVTAWYDQNIFEGQSVVSGAASATAGYTRSNDNRTAYINNCSPINGCKVSFAHNIKRVSGGGTIGYRISRTSNMITSTRAIANNNNVKSGSSGNPSGERVSSSGEWTLYPGMVVCERMTFRAYNTPGSGDIYTQVCAAALGDAQPGDATGDNALVDINVKNDNVSVYNSYRKEVYAKPGDKLSYQGSYHPWLQYTYYLIPQKMRVNGETIYPTSGINTSNNLATMYNSYKGSLRNWNNSLTIFSENFDVAYSQNYSRTNGDFALYKPTANQHTVTPSEVGRSLNEYARTNVNASTQTTPSQVTFSNSSSTNLGNVITTQKSAVASAKIPYNFNNTTEVTFNDANNTLYAGENKTIPFNIYVNTRQNNTTSGNYATIVRNAKWKLEICYNGSCFWTNERTGNLNNSGYSTSRKTEAKEINMNIPDVKAGTSICFRSAVYPATSGAETNWNDAGGNYAWAYSPQKCYTVAKKPSLQIWGGNIYTKGNISTAVAAKGNLAGYNTYGPEASYTKQYFGSWGEMGVVAGGSVAGFSSGASLGFTANNGGALVSNPGGSSIANFCNRSPITFANKPCTGGTVGLLGNSIAIGEANTEKTALIDRFLYGGEPNVVSNVTLNNPSAEKEGGVYYYYGTNNLTIGASTVVPSTIQIVHSTGDIKITGDIKYDSAVTYSSLSHLPKLIVYAKNNISINCGVKQVDAILIAENTVTTCGDSNDINSQANSNQLMVNGAVITNQLIPNRTYGAATGANSIIPAEIINFDPSLYLWGGSETTASEGINTNLDVSHTKEVAPRL